MADTEDFDKNWTLTRGFDWLVSFDSSALRHESVKEIADFSEVEEIFKLVQNYLEKIDMFKVRLLNDQARERFTRSTEEIIKLTSQASNSDFSNKNITQMRDGFANQYRQVFENMTTIIGPYYNAVTKDPVETKPEDAPRLLDRIKGYEEAIAKAQDATLKIQNMERKAETSISAIAKVAAESSVKTEATHFTDESEGHKILSICWLIAAGAGAAVIIGVAGWAYWAYEPTANIAGIDWNQLLPRFSILVLLLFFEIAIIGIYRAERHNAIVNKHRANALSTFETLTQAAVTQEIRDAITLTAAGAIYAPQDTGFSRHTTPQAMNAADILSKIAQNR